MKKYVVVDIDGTIADIQKMAKYPLECEQDVINFKEACDTCLPHDDIIYLLDVLSRDGKTIVFCTARPEVVRQNTLIWINTHLPFLKERGIEITLYMRKDGDERPDNVIKIPMMESVGITPDNTFMVLEDKAEVTKSWRKAGYRCMQVTDGDTPSHNTTFDTNGRTYLLKELKGHKNHHEACMSCDAKSICHLMPVDCVDDPGKVLYWKDITVNK